MEWSLSFVSEEQAYQEAERRKDNEGFRLIYVKEKVKEIRYDRRTEEQKRYEVMHTTFRGTTDGDVLYRRH